MILILWRKYVQKIQLKDKFFNDSNLKKTFTIIPLHEIKAQLLNTMKDLCLHRTRACLK